MRQIVLTALTVTIFLGGPVVVMSSHGNVSDMEVEFSQKCGSDVKEFCFGIKPGDGRLMKCLKENSESISGECSQYTESLKKEVFSRMREFRRACGSDMSRFCSGVKRGEGRILRCLYSKRGELQEGCRSVVDEYHVMTQ